MTPFEILKAARQLLCDKDWCQGTYARDKYGCSIKSTAPNAVCFCALGAVLRISSPDEVRSFNSRHPGYDAAEILRRAIRFETPIGLTSPSVFEWNDHPRRTKEEVIAAFDAAIKSLE